MLNVGQGVTDRCQREGRYRVSKLTETKADLEFMIECLNSKNGMGVTREHFARVLLSVVESLIEFEVTHEQRINPKADTSQDR
jgi:meiotically up-regulated gene 157 (Mug157) protein